MNTEFVFAKDMKFRNAVLLTGLPGIGLVGKIAVDYLLKHLKAVKVADIYSDTFPPSVQSKKGIVEPITDKLYYYSHDGKDYLFLAGPVQPSLDMRMGAPEEHYEFAYRIIDALKARGVTKIYTLAGLNVGERRMSSTPKIIVAATSKKALEEWTKAGAKVDKPEGLITGAAGLILGAGQRQGLEGACLMGETNAKLIYGDHGAAKEMIALLIKKFGFKIDMSGIEKEAKEIEKAFKELSKQFEEEPEEMPKTGLTYVR